MLHDHDTITRSLTFSNCIKVHEYLLTSVDTQTIDRTGPLISGRGDGSQSMLTAHARLLISKQAAVLVFAEWSNLFDSTVTNQQQLRQHNLKCIS
jgi:hypothetical protein